MATPEQEAAELANAIEEVLSTSAVPLSAREISICLRSRRRPASWTRRDVNRVLYARRFAGRFSKIDRARWKLASPLAPVADASVPAWADLRADCAAYYLARRQREALLGPLGRRSLSAAIRCIAGDGTDLEFVAAFNTPKRRQDLLAGIRTCMEAVRTWQEGTRRDPRFTWILGAGVLEGGSDDLRQCILDGCPSCSPGFFTFLGDASHLGTWAPLLTIEFLNEVPHLKERHYSQLRLALGKACRSGGWGGCDKPWEADFPPSIASLPLTYLFALSPNSAMESLVSRFHRGGYLNIGHLAAVHPEAWRALHLFPRSDWLGLAAATSG